MRREQKDLMELMRHSGHYHRYFEGYAEKDVLDGTDGKHHIERVYVMPWHYLAVSDKKRIMIRVLYVLLFILGAGLNITAGLNQGVSGSAFYVAFATFLSFIAMFFLAIAMFSYITGPKRMTAWEFKSGPARVRSRSKLCVYLIAIEGAMLVLFAVFNSNCDRLAMVLNVVLTALSAFPFMTILFIEKKLPYDLLENDNIEHKGSFVIGS